MVISLASASPRPLQRTPPRPPTGQNRWVPRKQFEAKLPRRPRKNDRYDAEGAGEWRAKRAKVSWREGK